jgi:hypothetical protein
MRWETEIMFLFCSHLVKSENSHARRLKNSVVEVGVCDCASGAAHKP